MSEVSKEETIGERIKRIRESKGMSQKDLASKCGIIYQTIGKYERGILNPKLATIMEIANALDVEIDDILGLKATRKLKRDLFEHPFDTEIMDLRIKTTLDSENEEDYYRYVDILLHYLNKNGKQKVIEYIRDMLQIDEYLKN